MTGGGGKIAMNASWIAPNCWFSAPAMAPADSAAAWRSSNVFERTNTMPAFGAFTKPLIDRPGNATACATPGCSRMMSPMRWMTSSVRSSDARVRQLREGDEVLLVLRRDEAGRHLLEAEPGQPDQARVHDERDRRAAQALARSRPV